MSAERVHCLWEARAALGEGPLWHARHGRLYWVDILQGHLHALHPTSGERLTWTRQPALTAIAPRRQGGFIVATWNGLALWNDALDEERRIDLPNDEPPSNRCNDGKCDPRGRFFFGTMDAGEAATCGSFYVLEADRSLHRLETNIAIPNGPAFVASGERMIHVDTLERTLVAIRLDDAGAVCERRVLMHVDPALGYPDGLTIDAEDHIWLALWGGSAVLRIDPRGRIVRRIAIPAPHVTSCAFGGESHSTLFVTTARKGLTKRQEELHPLAGGLFAIELDIPGRPADSFAG